MDEDIERALCLRDEGRLEDADAELEKLISFVHENDGERSPDDAHTLACAQYYCGLIKHNLGKHAQADHHLSRLGFRYRLSNRILRPLAKELPRGIVQGTTVTDHVLPECIFSRLEKLLAGDSPFWAEHSYPNDAFWSYNALIGSEGAGGALVQDIVQSILPAACALAGDSVEFGSCEFWAHRREGAGAHQLHFDLDESALPEWRRSSRGKAPPHPVVSCVIYMNNIGPPTLVSDHNVDDGDDAEATRAALCFPKRNRLLLFHGGLLHGVAPADQGDSVAPRTTFMVGLWPKEHRPDEGNATSVTPLPNMRTPHSCGSTSSYVAFVMQSPR